MAKIIMISKSFLSYMVNAGEPTNFRHLIETGQKIHTIRSGNRIKVGDIVQLREWSGKPYRSPQVDIGKPFEVKRVDAINWDYNALPPNFDEIAHNDGLNNFQLFSWLQLSKQPFIGQIIYFTPCS